MLRVAECQLVSVQAHRWIGHRVRLLFANLFVLQIQQVPENGKAQRPAVDADLVRSTGQGNRLHQSGVVG